MFQDFCTKIKIKKCINVNNLYKSIKKFFTSNTFLCIKNFFIHKKNNIKLFLKYISTISLQLKSQ